MSGPDDVTRPPAPPLRVVVSSRSERLEDEQPRASADEATFDATVPPPPIRMPGGASFQPEEAELLEERLFDLSGEMMGAHPDAACRMALRLALELIPCRLGAVVRGTINDERLVVVSAIGLADHELVGERVPHGVGLVGMVFDASRPLRAEQVENALPHVVRVEPWCSAAVSAALAVPVRDDEGMVYGVIELLDPTSRSFSDEDEQALDNIARTLADALAFG